MKKLVVGLALSCAALCSSAVNADFFDGVCPQIGLDAKYAYVQAKRHGDDDTAFRRLSHKNFWGGNIYALFRFCECWGIELGYEHFWKRKRTTEIAGDRIRSRAGFNTFHADVNWYYGICDCWDAILSVGLAYTKPKLSLRNETTGATTTLSRFNGKSKILPRARIGLQYMIMQCFGVRGLIGWDNTSRLKARVDDEHFKPFKDTWSASLGIFYTFA